MLSKQKKSSLRHSFLRANNRLQRMRRHSIEPLETRQLLNAAPVGVDDSYRLTNFTLVVGSPQGTLAADESLPDLSNFTLDEDITVTSGQQQQPGYLTLGGQSNTYGQITVANPGSMLTINQYLDVGLVGLGRVTVTDGGVLHTTNWTELGQDSGLGIGVVSGAGSRWTNDNFFVVGDNHGRGRLTIENGAAMINGNHITVGDDGGQGMMVVSGGSTFTNLGWTEVGPHAGARGELTITGAGTKYTNRDWMEIGGAPQSSGIVTVMDGASLQIDNFAGIFPSGRLRGDGRIRIGNWFENRGTLEPGAPRGIMTLDANVTQFSTSRLEVEIGGAARGSGYDGLDVTGTYQAAGTLAVTFVNGFAPKAGDSFDLVRAASIGGSFANVTVQGLATGFAYRLTIEDGIVRLTATNDGIAIPAPASQGVLANDSDADGDALSAILVEGPTKGQLQLYANGAFRYVAGSNFDGSDTFVYRATDGFFRSRDVRVVLENSSPVAVNDSYTAVEDTVLTPTLSVLSNDRDAEGDLLAAQIFEGPRHGTVELRSDGTFVYAPNANFFGEDSFTYRAVDFISRSAPATVSIRVSGVQDPPVAVDDHVLVPESGGAGLTKSFLLENDFDPDGDAISFVTARATDQTHGTISISDIYVYYTAEPGYEGQAIIEYVITDGKAQSVGCIVITIQPNQAPTAVDDTKFTQQNQTLRFQASDLVRNDTDPDGDFLLVVGVGTYPDTHGTAELENGFITFVPEPGFTGNARFFYRVTDTRDGFDNGDVVVQVKPIPQSLLGRVQGAGSLDGRERAFSFHADSRRGQPTTSGQLHFVDFEEHVFFQSTRVNRLEISADGRHATFSGQGRLNGRTGFQFVITIEDRDNAGHRDKFRIQITGPRGFAYDSLDHAEQQGAIDRGGNIRIEPLRPRTLVELLMARQLGGVSAAGDESAESLETPSAAPSFPPIAKPDVYHAAEDEVFHSPVSVLANDIDDMPATLTARLVAIAPNTGTLEMKPDGNFTYTPAPNFTGYFNLFYVASDGMSESEWTMVEVYVDPRNDPPVAHDDELVARAGEHVGVSAFRLLSNDLEIDGERIRVVDIGQPDPAKASIEVSRFPDEINGFEFTSAPGFQGDVTFPYTISDASGSQSTAQVTFHVGPPNRLPLASTDRKTTFQDTTLRFPLGDLLANDTDPDNDALRVVLVGDAMPGGLVFIDDDNLVIFSPPAGFVGTAHFTYTISDEHGGTDDGSVEVQVNPFVQTVPGLVYGTGSLDGFERLFAFRADNRLGTSAISGQLSFFDLQRRVFFQSTSLIRLLVATDGRSATIEGEGKLNGRTGYQFIATIGDRSRAGGRDTFRIQITGPANSLYDSLAHAEQDGRIDRLGNIQIQPLRPRTLIDLNLAHQIAFEEIGAASRSSTTQAKRVLIAR